MPKQDIAARYKADDAKRQPILETARLCAALSKPWLLPPQDHSPNDRLPENYQSLGSRGLTNIEGRMLMALFPPTMPFFELDVAPDIKYDPSIDQAMLHEVGQQLYLRELMAMAVLESSNLGAERGRRRHGFRSRKRNAISQVLATGDALEQLTDDYRIKVFRRDQYVTKRDSAGDVLYHIVSELIDPITLDDDKLELSGLNKGELEDKNAADRMMDLYTRVEWNPGSKTWIITQEINGNEINESEENISPFFSTPYELAPNEDYGRGLIELNLGDLKSYNELRERMLDFAALHSKQNPVADYTSKVNDDDFSRKSGELIRARVRGGQAEDIGWFGPNTVANFQVVQAVTQEIRTDLGTAMLMEMEAQPRQDRVTAEQVRRIAMELEGALGGVYAPIAEEQQVPLMRRVLYQLQRDNILTTLPDESIEIKASTGVTALAREMDGSKLMAAMQTIMQIPGAPERINMDVLMDLTMRYAGIHEPGLIKSKEQMMQEMAQQVQAQAAQAAAEEGGKQAAEVAGDAARQQIAPPNQQEQQ